MSGSTAWRAWSRPAAWADSRLPIPSGPVRAGGARRCCESAGCGTRIRPQLVLGDTIAQAAQFATTGNAVGGLVAYSLVLGPGFADRGNYAVIPEADHPPLRQRMVLLKRAGATATQFYPYLQGDAARAILRKHGYGVPQ